MVNLTIGTDADITLTAVAAGSATTITSNAADAVTLTIDGGGWQSATTAISGSVNLTGVNADLTAEVITGAVLAVTDELDAMNIATIGASGCI